MDRLIRTLIYGIIAIQGKLNIRRMMTNAQKADRVNNKLLMRIIDENKDSVYGRKYGFADIHSVADFKSKVPIIEYKDVASYVDRIYFDNEQNVLTSHTVVGFARSSGSIGTPKFIPRTACEVDLYARMVITRFLELSKRYDRARGKRTFRPGRGLCALAQHRELSPHGLVATNIADITAKRFYKIYPYMLNLPLRRQFSADEIDMTYALSRFGLEDRNLVFFYAVFAKSIAEFFEYIRNNWQMLCLDIETGTIADEISCTPEIREQLLKVLRPNPRRADEIRHEIEKGFDETIGRRLWPHLMVLSAIGTSSSFDSFVRTIRGYTDGIPFDYSLYASSEGLFAASFEADNPGQLMLPDSCYYEFIDEVADEEDTTPITKTYSLNELSVGKNYELIITNQSGLYRYRMGDIITVLRMEGKCPIINFVYRRGQLLNINGEKTNLAQMSEAVRRLEKDSGIEIREWAVYVDRGKVQYRYILCTETENGVDLSGYAEQFEEHLREVNTSYRYYEQVKNLIEPPVIRCQIPGSHHAWREYKLASGVTHEQLKPVRIFDSDEKMRFFLSRIK